MKTLSLLVPALTLAGSIAAQATADLTTLTPVAVLSTATGNPPPSFVGVPANSAASALSLWTVNFGLNGVRLTTIVANGPAETRVSVQANVLFLPGISGQIAGTSPSPSAANATTGPVELLARFQAPPGALARLAISTARFVSPQITTAVNQTSVDIGADGTPEIVSPSLPTPFVVPIAPNGELLVRITIENRVTSTGQVANSIANALLVLELLPPAACTITPYGSGCGGAASTGSEVVLGTTRAITLLGDGAFPGMPVLSLFGAQNAGPTLPGGCALLTDATIAVPLLADPFGVAVHTFTLPVAATGTLYHQFVPVDFAPLAFRASNGLEIVCTP